MGNDNGNEKREDHLEIFVNEKKFEKGIQQQMTVDAIAGLVGLTAENAVVRRLMNGKAGDPLQGVVEIKSEEHFVVTRKHVEGGFDEPVFMRVEAELAKLRLGGQLVTLVRTPAAVIFHNLPAAPTAPQTSTDVMVLIPAGYPASMLDGAFLPEGSPLIGRVKGAAQGTIAVAGHNWRLISYHPHNGGGGPPWNPNLHGFHSYIDELLTWLGAV